MGRFPYGPATGHILTSQGPDIELNRFYITAYATNYCKKDFEPQAGRHLGTGYKSNLRPTLTYKKRLDDVDNPQIGQLLVNAYDSGTYKKDYIGSVNATGTEALPNINTQTLGGFGKDIPKTLTSSKEIAKAHFDTGEPGVLYPKSRPLLYALKRHDPVMEENLGYGPAYMETETSARFPAEQRRRVNTADATIGRKELSGFSKAFTVEPITFRAYTAKPSYRLPDSVMRQDYSSTKYLSGKESFPSVATHSQRSDGYTEGTTTKILYLDKNKSHGYTDQEELHPIIRDRIKKKDPVEYVNITNPNKNKNLSKVQFDGRLGRDKSNNERVGFVNYGKKELSGFSDNNISKAGDIQGTYEKDRFHTNYLSKYYDMTPKDRITQRGTVGVQMPIPNGFTKGIQVHSHGKSFNTTSALRSLNPYVARSIKRRDPLFDDHTHDHRLRKK